MKQAYYRQGIKAKIRELKSEGYKQVKSYPCIYINEAAQVFDIDRNLHLSINAKQCVKINGKCVSVPKMMLEAFRGEPYLHNVHISYKDGNRLNLSVSNLDYSRICINEKPELIDTDGLYMAIRCYFAVNKRFGLGDHYMTHYYLQLIVERRNFIHSNAKDKHIYLFADYVQQLMNQSIAHVANKHGIGVRDASCIINGYLNKLVSDIKNDMDNGLLSVMEYRTKRRNSKADCKRRIQKICDQLKGDSLPVKPDSTDSTVRDIVAQFKAKRAQAVAFSANKGGRYVHK